MCTNWMSRRTSALLLLHCSRRNYGNDEEVESAMMSGASTPYKRWSKCTMEKVGEAFLQKLRGEVH